MTSCCCDSVAGGGWDAVASGGSDAVAGGGSDAVMGSDSDAVASGGGHCGGLASSDDYQTDTCPSTEQQGPGRCRGLA